MAIQWYPGHMHKAQKEIKEALPGVDLIIEVVDARIPYSSANPVIAELSRTKGLNKPILKVINKTDLADPKVTQDWCDYLDKQQGVKALAISASKPEQVKKIIGLCRKLAPHRVEKERPVRAMIMGIPNVGKSTIINILANRIIAKVGNEPAVTKRQQRIDLDDGVVLFDTPGILWPKIENQNSSYRLAVTGAIKDTVLEYDDIAFYAMDYLKKHYEGNLYSKFKLEPLEANQFSDEQGEEETLFLLETIGKQRGCLMSGGRVDLDKVCKILINQYRTAGLGAISLETPSMIEVELIEVAEAAKLKEEKEALRKKKGKKRKR